MRAGHSFLLIFIGGFSSPWGSEQFGTDFLPRVAEPRADLRKFVKLHLGYCDAIQVSLQSRGASPILFRPTSTRSPTWLMSKNCRSALAQGRCWGPGWRDVMNRRRPPNHARGRAAKLGSRQGQGRRLCPLLSSTASASPSTSASHHGCPSCQSSNGRDEESL